MATPTTRYLRTDHWADAVSSLEAAQDFAGRVSTDERFWKWLLIAMHSAVQGFMALALEQGNALLVMKEDLMVKWLKAHESGSTYPESRMDFFLSLYEKVKSDAVCRYVHSKKFVPGPSHDYSMEKLNELRNDFIHFFPKGWSIQLAGLPKICIDCLEIAHFLGWESMTILWHNASLNERGREASAQLRSRLEALNTQYNPVTDPPDRSAPAAPKHDT
jgi:hypothetical protein